MLLEICIDCVESALAAKQGGADRLEVCGSLTVGGTTPSFGLVEQCVADVELPVMMMIRPHDGGFVYGRDELDTMFTDIEVAKSIGVLGVVFGCLDEQRAIHLEQCKQLVDAAGELETTFHRAFDLVPDPQQAVDELLELGVTRVLTSGQSTSAEAGIPLLRKLVQQAGDRMSILAGAGVNAANASTIAKETGVTEIHASASVIRDDAQAHGNVSFGDGRRVTCATRAREIKAAIS